MTMHPFLTHCDTALTIEQRVRIDNLDRNNQVEVTMHSQRNTKLIDVIALHEVGPRKRLARRVRHCFWQGLLAVLLGVAGAAQVMAAPLQLPALLTPASQEHHVGKVIFVELLTPDLAAAKRFYGGLFGWTFRDIQTGGIAYAEASLEDHPVAGLIHRDLPAGAQRQPAWLTFIAVRDVDAAQAAALQHGAKVLYQPHSIPDRGREAVFADPQGAVFAVLASSSGDPPDVLGAPGDWIWSSLMTTEPDTAAEFYQTLFDYEVFDFPADKPARHLMLASDSYARASANRLPVSRPDSHPHWLNYIRVDDTVKMTEKVVSLGGRVLVEPRVDRHGGRIAVVADPQGAAFGLLEWPTAETKKVTK
jgi:predicted enzyme related to lactoylglutathione lyase